MRYLLTICLLLLIAWPAFADGCEVLFAAKSQWCATPKDSTFCTLRCVGQADSSTCWERCYTGADSAMCWRKGDPLFAREIGFPWPRGENPDSTDSFMVITVTDKSPDHTNAWLERYRYDGPDSTLTGLRLRYLKWSTLPGAVKTQLLETGRYTASWAQIKPFVQNRRTGGMGE